MATAFAEWELWSTTARVVTTRSDLLEPARQIAVETLAEVDAACSRFRTDSELARASAALADGVEISPLLALLVKASLDVARDTDGDVDPTLGFALDAVGYDRDIRLVEDDDRIVRAVVSRKPGWKSVSLTGTVLRVPTHLSLDLGATAKAVAADLVAAQVTAELETGVLVSLGGDIATSGKQPEEGWDVLVRDLPLDPATTVRIRPGSALATSSTQKRRWSRGAAKMHHILDPRTGLPAPPVWRSVTVSADRCLTANAMSTASIIRGESAIEWLAQRGATARLVRADGRVFTVGGWPAETEVDALDSVNRG